MRSDVGRFDSLFVSPRALDVPLSCPGRVRAEADRGRRVLVLALFEPEDETGPGAQAVGRLGATYLAAGLPDVTARRSGGSLVPVTERSPDDGEAVVTAAHLLADVGPRTEAVHIHAPLGLGASVDYEVAYEASVRAFATGFGKNLFLYEERPEAFVPGAVRTRLALLGARLPPAGADGTPRVSLTRALWRANEPCALRGERRGLGARFAELARVRRRFRLARRWKPLRAFGPRLQPLVHSTDEETRELARDIACQLLVRDRKGRPRGGRRFNKRASQATKTLGAVYHAERVWLFLPSGEGLHEIRHPLDSGD
jgi:hypothetical protein